MWSKTVMSRVKGLRSCKYISYFALEYLSNVVYVSGVIIVVIGEK